MHLEPHTCSPVRTQPSYDDEGARRVRPRVSRPSDTPVFDSNDFESMLDRINASTGQATTQASDAFTQRFLRAGAAGTFDPAKRSEVALKVAKLIGDGRIAPSTTLHPSIVNALVRAALAEHAPIERSFAMLSNLVSASAFRKLQPTEPQMRSIVDAGFALLESPLLPTELRAHSCASMGVGVLSHSLRLTPQQKKGLLLHACQLMEREDPPVAVGYAIVSSLALALRRFPFTGSARERIVEKIRDFAEHDNLDAARRERLRNAIAE